MNLKIVDIIAPCKLCGSKVVDLFIQTMNQLKSLVAFQNRLHIKTGISTEYFYYGFQKTKIVKALCKNFTTVLITDLKKYPLLF